MGSARGRRVTGIPTSIPFKMPAPEKSLVRVQEIEDPEKFCYELGEAIYELSKEQEISRIWNMKLLTLSRTGWVLFFCGLICVAFAAPEFFALRSDQTPISVSDFASIIRHPFVQCVASVILTAFGLFLVVWSWRRDRLKSHYPSCPSG